MEDFRDEDGLVQLAYGLCLLIMALSIVAVVVSVFVRAIA